MDKRKSLEGRTEPAWIAPESLSDRLTLLPALVPVYQKAFAGEPWYEVSKCSGCPRGFSGDKPGATCSDCGNLLTEEAYPASTLLPDLEMRVRANPSFVYAETDARGTPVLGTIAYRGRPADIYKAKYIESGRGSTETSELFSLLPNEIGWLDEIFADRDMRPRGNLANFGAMCGLMAERLDTRVIAFRTINKALIAKAKGTFANRCATVEVPDTGTSTQTSTLVIINME